MAKTNNPEGINQYTGKGKSSKEPYRYSIGGYFATQKKQKELDETAEVSRRILKKNFEEDDKLRNKELKTTDKILAVSKIQSDLGFKKYMMGTNPDTAKIFAAQSKPMSRSQRETSEFIYNSAEISKSRLLQEREQIRSESKDLRKYNDKLLKNVQESMDYREVSRPASYVSNLKNQTVNDAKQAAENIRKRIWGG